MTAEEAAKTVGVCTELNTVEYREESGKQTMTPAKGLVCLPDFFIFRFHRINCR